MPSVFSAALGKELVRRVAEGIHSAYIKTLGKFEDSSSEDGDGHWRVLISLSGSSPPRRDHNQVAKLSSAIRTIATNQGASMNSWRRETILFQLYFQRPLKLAILEPPMSAEGLSVIWQSSIAGAPDASYS